MAAAQTKSAGRKTQRVDGFDLREIQDGGWEVIDSSSGKAVRISGNLLTRLTKDEAQGAIHLLKAEAVKPDQPR
jgi:hypothetical protein